jgi:tRNA threonylcarbamoyladenosine biosynthesis protein TsaB
MLLLITDTSGKSGSVALARADFSSEVVVIESVPLAGGMFSAQLVPQIAALLAKHGFSKTDIDAFVVVSGPGSFTGLRVGLAAIKALAEILGKPIVPVSLLEVIALSSGASGRVLALLDAGRGDAYAGAYEVSGDEAQLVREQLLARDEFLSAGREAVVATPDQALAGIVRAAGFSVVAVDFPGAEAIARLGWRKLQAGQTVTPEQLEANYIRRTDAEILAKHNSDSQGMAHSVNLRRATAADIASVADLERACPAAAHWTEAQYRQLLQAEAGSERFVLVAECSLPSAPGNAGDRSTPALLGFLVARHLAPEWELENIVVAPAARRRGIGQSLLDTLLAGARETNSSVVFLEVRESNAAARSLYEKAGFQPTGRRKLYYANPSEDAMLYRKSLL